MSLRRVGILLGKELVRGPKNFLFIFAIVIPLVITLAVSLFFGTLFTGKPKLGIVDEGGPQGGSQIVHMATEVGSLIVREYGSASALKQATAAGVVDVGMVLPAGFDSTVTRGEQSELTAYVWGESLLKNRAILATTVAVLIRKMAGHEPPVEIVTTTLGDGESMPWEERLLPFIVLMTLVMGGTMVPATALVDEKQKRTLGALTITPTTLEEVFMAKGLLGVILSLLMGVLILVMNRAFGAQPLLLLLVLALGASMAATVGVLFGAFIKDINTLFATIKAIGILLYAPALVYLFPQIPQWIGKIFPTYYMIQPVVEITQQGATWRDVAGEVFILVGLILVLVCAVAVVARRMGQQEV